MDRDTLNKFIRICNPRDVWSLGVVLYETLSGRVPFDGPNANVVMVKILTQPVPRVNTVAPEVPQAIAEVIQCALQIDRKHRYASMSELLAGVMQSPVGGAALLDRHRVSIVGHAESPSSYREIANSTNVLPKPPVPSGVSRSSRPPADSADDGAATLVNAPALVITPLDWSDAATLKRITSPPPERSWNPMLVLLAVTCCVCGLLAFVGFLQGERSRRQMAAIRPTAPVITAEIRDSGVLARPVDAAVVMERLPAASGPTTELVGSRRRTTAQRPGTASPRPLAPHPPPRLPDRIW